MEFGVLGPLMVRVGDADVTPAAAKPRALLVRLLIAGGRQVSADLLIEDLWEGDPPRSAAQTLQSYISQLRKLLGADRLLTDAAGYRLVVAPDEVDAASFESALAEGRGLLTSGDAAAATARLEHALSLWRGLALADARGAAWSTAEAIRLNELRLDAVESLLEARLAQGQLAEVVAAAESALAEHPLRERVWALLITSLYRQGRQAEALRAYQRVRTLLGDELGIEPGAELRALEHAVLEQDPGLTSSSASNVPGFRRPSGVVTFLFTDVESSTNLWDAAPDSMRAALERHDEIVRRSVEAHDGYVFSATGDGFAVAFSSATDAMAAATSAQSFLSTEEWPASAPIKVRMGLNTGEVDERDGNYFGPAVNKAARIMAAAHGRQLLVSSSTATLLDRSQLVALGEHSLPGLSATEVLFQIGAEKFPPLRSLGTSATNLPLDRSVFVGRDKELEDVTELLRRNRIVTLTGVGGVGKTRLAIQAASSVVNDFPGGVWLVELAPLIDAALVVTTVASTVGAPQLPGGEAIDAVWRFLAARRALIVLDNCEHVIDAAAHLVDVLSEAAPEVRILATSREPLGVIGESVWRVPSLSIDAEGGVGDALALFAERASHVRSKFILAGAELRSVAAICRRLDGIPLAIELAAARTNVMSVEQVAARLDERFRLLTRGGRTAVARQQTLQGAIDWSYELLSERERSLFDRLGVFAGDFDVRSVASVAGLDEYEALNLVGQLVERSMLEVDTRCDRYRLLETLRQYAWDHLVTSEEIGRARNAHADWFLILAGEQAARMHQSGQQVAALDRLELDYDNLRAALAYFIEVGSAADAARLARRLIGLFNIRYPQEGLAWFEQVVEIADGLPATTHARLLADAAYAAMCAGDGPSELRHAEASINLAGDDAPAVSHWLLGQQVLIVDPAAAVGRFRLAMTKAELEGDRTTQVEAMTMLAIALAELGQAAEARSLIREGIDSAEELGNPTITGSVLLLSARVLAGLGDWTEARILVERGLNEADAAGPIVASGLRATFAMLVDDPTNVAPLLRKAIPIVRDQLSEGDRCYLLLAAGKVLVDAGREENAVRLLGQFIRHSEAAKPLYSLGTSRPNRWFSIHADQITGAIDRSVLDREVEEGPELTLNEALQLASDALAEVSP